MEFMENAMVEALLFEFIKLNDYAKSPNFDSKTFEMMCKNYADKYKLMEKNDRIYQQGLCGELAYLILIEKWSASTIG